MTSHLGNLVERERAMTKLLNNGPEEHLDLVEKMQKGLKVRRIDDDLRLKGIWLRREGADRVQIYFIFQN